MDYAIDTSEIVTKKGCRKNFLSQIPLEDGIEFTVKQNKYHMLRFAAWALLITVGACYLFAGIGGDKMGAGGIIMLIFVGITVLLSGLIALLGGCVAVFIALTAQSTKKFIISRDGVVLLNFGGRLRKKLLPWEHVERLWAESKRHQDEISIEMDVRLSTGAIGALSNGARDTGREAGEFVSEAMKRIDYMVAIEYKNRTIKLADYLSDVEAEELIAAIRHAR